MPSNDTEQRQSPLLDEDAIEAIQYDASSKREMAEAFLAAQDFEHLQLIVARALHAHADRPGPLGDWDVLSESGRAEWLEPASDVIDALFGEVA